MLLDHQHDGEQDGKEDGKEIESGQSAAVNAMAARSDMSIEGLRRTFRDHVFYTQGRFLEGLEGPGKNDLYMALSYTVRDQLMHRWIKTVDQIVQRLSQEDVKVVAYLSANSSSVPIWRTT